VQITRRGINSLLVQHIHIEPGVVGNDDGSLVTGQLLQLGVGFTSPKKRFALDHPVGDVVDGHGIDGDRHTGIEQFADCRTTLGLEGDLAEPVFGPGAGGFRVEEDEHAYPPFTFFRNFPAYLKVTTRLAGRIASSPVAGFRPLR
jgi:hypothetical protein